MPSKITIFVVLISTLRMKLLCKTKLPAIEYSSIHKFLSDLPPCFSSPCENEGRCFQSDDGSDYICFCQPGWTGVNCETPIDLCDSGPCQNGASCNNFQTFYTCDCPPGFTGADCEIGKNQSCEYLKLTNICKLWVLPH